jgi:hypothetical protein
MGKSVGSLNGGELKPAENFEIIVVISIDGGIKSRKYEEQGEGVHCFQKEVHCFVWFLWFILFLF